MLGKLAELMLFGIAPLAVGGLIMPGVVLADEVEIVGEVSYRERMALPPNAVLTVQLADVSLADAPASIVSEQKVEPAGQVPIPFSLKFDQTVIQPKVNYAVQTRITVNDKLWFINDERQSVDPAHPEPMKIVLKRVARDAAAPVSIFDTTWLAEDIGGGGVIDNAQSTFTVDRKGAVTGRAGCNGYFARATIEGEDRIKIGKAGATMMACPDALMDQERKFLDALGKAASFRFNEEGKLFLVDEGGADLVRFSRAG